MKISISNIAWTRLEDEQISRVLSELSIKGIEVAPTMLWDNPLQQSDESVRDCLTFWEEKNIEIVAMQSLLFGQPDMLVFKDYQTRKETISYLSKIIELGSQLGVKIYVFGSPKNRLAGKLGIKEVTDIAIEFFSALGEIAYKNKAKFCIEPNSSLYGCDFINTTDEGIELVKKVAHPGFGLHLDAGVMALNCENYEESLERAFEYLEHFHISEPYLQEIGKGKTDHTRITDHLRRLNYNKWVSIEMRNGLMESNIRTVKNSLEYVLERYSA